MAVLPEIFQYAGILLISTTVHEYFRLDFNKSNPMAKCTKFHN